MEQKQKPKRLGRGLESLIGPIMLQQSQGVPERGISLVEVKSRSDKDLHSSMREIAVDSISPNPYQPRTQWDQEQLADLAESIKANGVVQPVIVRPGGEGYELIAGERRLRAAQMANLKTIPAVVRQATDEQLLELALVENIHRTDLNPIERAEAYKQYLAKFSLGQSEAAQRLGENRSVIANHLRLLELPQQVKQMLVDGRLSNGHGRAILALPTDDLRRKLANRALAGRLSVREVEKLVRRQLTGGEKSKAQKPAKPAHIEDLERNLSSQLGTKVGIETKKGGQKGKIIIDFYSLEEFDRLVEDMGLTVGEQL